MTANLPRPSAPSRFNPFALLACMLALLAACVTAPPANTTASLDPLSAMMEGHFSSRAQAQSDKDFLDIELRVVRIWRDRTDGPWLYVEQATAAQTARPYRQRVYQLMRTPQGFASRVYLLPGDALRFAGQWREAAPLAAVTPADLLLRDGCTVWLTAKGGGYAGATQGQQCASDLRGASYATSEVVIDSKGMTSWDRGFNAAGQQVWGAVKGGYRFDRL